MISPEDDVNCTKCDVLLCQELSDTSPKAELLEIDVAQVESVKRVLTFTEEMKSFRDITSDSEISLSTTISHDSLSPIGSHKRHLSTSSSSSSEIGVADEDTETNDTEYNKSEDALSSAETLKPSSSQTSTKEIAYLKKRQRSSYQVGSTSFVNVIKKKRVNF